MQVLNVDGTAVARCSTVLRESHVTRCLTWIESSGGSVTRRLTLLQESRVLWCSLLIASPGSLVAECSTQSYESCCSILMALLGVLVASASSWPLSLLFIQSENFRFLRGDSDSSLSTETLKIFSFAHACPWKYFTCSLFDTKRSDNNSIRALSCCAIFTDVNEILTRSLPSFSSNFLCSEPGREKLWLSLVQISRILATFGQENVGNIQKQNLCFSGHSA